MYTGFEPVVKVYITDDMTKGRMAVADTHYPISAFDIASALVF